MPALSAAERYSSGAWQGRSDARQRPQLTLHVASRVVATVRVQSEDRRAAGHEESTERKAPVAEEIEHKFLVTSDSWRTAAVRSNILRQGYLAADAQRSVRVRLVDAPLRGFLTVKGARLGNARSEFEYEIAAGDAEFMLEQLCQRPLIEKRRWELSLSPGNWIVDEFLGSNAGLVLAEVELPEADAAFAVPQWLGEDVTADNRYANSSLQGHPFQCWS